MSKDGDEAVKHMITMMQEDRLFLKREIDRAGRRHAALKRFGNNKKHTIRRITNQINCSVGCCGFEPDEAGNPVVATSVRGFYCEECYVFFCCHTVRRAAPSAGGGWGGGGGRSHPKLVRVYRTA